MQGIFGAEHPCGAVLGATAQPSRSSASTEPSTTEPTASASDSTAAAITNAT